MADNTDLLGAISAAIDSAGDSPAPAPDPEENDDAADSTAGETDESGAAAGAAAGDDTEPEGGADGAGDGEGDAEGAKGDGKDKKPAEEAAKPELDADGKPIVKPEAPKDDKLTPQQKLDKAVNDPIDQRLSERTRDRMQLLANEVKTIRPQLEHANTLFDAIDSSGMGADELATMLGYARARHHGSAEDKQQAYGFLKAEMRALALELGETSDVNFLTEHPDLQAAVDANQITAEYAQEVALSRSRGARDAQHATVTTEQKAAQQAHSAGVQALTTLGTALSTRDGAAVYSAKKAVIIATLGPRKDPLTGQVLDAGVLASIHPSKWAQTFQRAYEAMPKPAAAAPKAQVVPKQQPQRPSTPAGGNNAKKEPKSLYDAVSAAVDGDDN